MSQVAVSPTGMESRSIHEMLKDAPSLNESDGAVHSGTPPPHVPNNNRKESQPATRPATMNLNLGTYTSQSCKSIKYDFIEQLYYSRCNKIMLLLVDIIFHMNESN